MVAIVRVYEDPLHVINIARAEPCSTVYAQASGLSPSTSGFRFAWRDGSGLTVRFQDVVADSNGECVDALASQVTEWFSEWIGGGVFEEIDFDDA